MAAPPTRADLDAPVAAHLRPDVMRLFLGQTVGEALEWLRAHPPRARVLYLYVVDQDGRLCGVVPTRRLLLSAPGTPLAEVMVTQVVALPAGATAREACEFFIRHRLLAFPVVDEDNKLLGIVDVELYTDALSRLDEATPVGRLVAPLARFLQIESSGGLVLLAFTAAALVLANSPWSADFAAFWQTPVGFTAGGAGLTKPLLLWVNDGLMTLFFFVVGLEIKYEVVSGELADPRKALLPIVAAVGGMVVPAGVYLLCVRGGPGRHGWGVPMATDIAFVVGILTLLGPRVPHGLKVLLLTLAIADDIGAVLVIAVAYSTHIAFPALGFAAAGLVLGILLLRAGVRSGLVYLVLAVSVWLAFLKSGVHPTVAGVLLGLLTPARAGVRRRVRLDLVGELYARLRGVRGGTPVGAPEAVSPLERLQDALHPWVAFVIMPVFALANAGVKVELAAVGTPIALAVAAGLILGKPAGIFVFSWAAKKAGVARLPKGVGWKALVGAGCLGGIGFTMALFIAGLALEGPMLDEAKIGILSGSTASAVLGCLLLVLFLPRPAGLARAGEPADPSTQVARPPC